MVWKLLLVSLRPRQWTKNLIVFAGLVFSGGLFHNEDLFRSTSAFLIFCFLSGVVYIINDVCDIERDRKHPRKSLRPIASGALSPRVALAAAAVILLLALCAAFFLNKAFLLVLAIYLCLSVAYSLAFKNVVIVDVLFISMGFVLRALGGTVVIGVNISSWLLVCTILLALFLSLCKRRAELVMLADSATEHRRILDEYSPYLLDQMIAVVTASTLMAYTLYTMAEETMVKFQTTRLNLTIPFVIYGIFRYLYLIHQKEEGGSPSRTLLNDRPLMINTILWVLAVVAIIYGHFLLRVL
jgi:4-hydroxybenzoate polyprenyltransferase